MSNVYDVGLCVFAAQDESASRSFSLLPSGESGSHNLGEDNYPFENDAESASESPTWYTLESVVPFVQCASRDSSDAWAGPSTLRPSASSPLINVWHEVSIDLTCTYNIPGTDQVATELLSFLVPIRFAHIAPDLHTRCFTPPPAHFPQMEMVDNVASSPSLPMSPAYAPSLPAYSQLFDSNGDRKIDYSVPLPLYTPRSLDASSSILDLLDDHRKGANETDSLLPIA